MHMADALLSPGTGVLMWVASCAVMSVAARRVQQRADDRLMPLMGMLGAFVFAAQMVNFSIPGTGSSGHLGGGLLLAILLGPHAAFIVVASVLTVQALFFADGGLLALGANMFNIGVLPCYLAYPLVYRPLAGTSPSPKRAAFATVLAAVVGLQLGALAVVLQTVASGISSLPASAFLGLMLPIHLAIGVVEGLATAALVGFLRRARPELLDAAVSGTAVERRRVLLPLTLAAVFTGGVLSWFASSLPDGLEWSVAHAAGSLESAAPAQGLHAALQGVQQRLAWLPDYALGAAAVPEPAQEHVAAAAWPEVNAVTTLAGLVGGAVTFALVMLIGLLLRRRRVRH
jgi:cobalt/nickel transport system permease protein